jgi:hypothetical protein
VYKAVWLKFQLDLRGERSLKRLGKLWQYGESIFNEKLVFDYNQPAVDLF